MYDKSRPAEAAGNRPARGPGLTDGEVMSNPQTESVARGAATAGPIIALEGIEKSFGPVSVLRGVRFDVRPGEVHALMGENGAGKSTLMKIIAGNFPPSTGTISLDGEEVVFHKPVEARRKGIEIVYQDLALCDNLTAAANVFLGREIRRSLGPIRYLDHAAMNRQAGELFAEFKSETRPRDLVRQMSGGQRQAVAIARTRLSDPKLVLMDEPTAAISVRLRPAPPNSVGTKADRYPASRRSARSCSG